MFKCSLGAMLSSNLGRKLPSAECNIVRQVRNIQVNDSIRGRTSFFLWWQGICAACSRQE